MKPTTVDRRSLLQHLPIFSSFEGHELDPILEMTTSKHLESGCELFHKGSDGASLYGVIRGRLKVLGSSSEGKDIVFHLMGAGDTLGEIALLDGKQRSASVVAMEDSELIVLHRRELIAFLERNPSAALKLAEGLAAIVRRLSQSIEDLHFRSLPSRLARRLLELAGAYGRLTEGGATQIDLRLPQQAIGELVGTSRETINKQLRIWGELSLVHFERGTITLLDLDRLEDLADSSC